MLPIGVTQPKVCWGVLYLLDSCGVPGRQLPCQLLYLNRLDFGLAQNAEVDFIVVTLGNGLIVALRRISQFFWRHDKINVDRILKMEQFGANQMCDTIAINAYLPIA